MDINGPSVTRFSKVDFSHSLRILSFYISSLLERSSGLSFGYLLGNMIFTNVRYADDTVFIAPSVPELQVLVDNLASA